MISCVLNKVLIDDDDDGDDYGGDDTLSNCYSSPTQPTPPPPTPSLHSHLTILLSLLRLSTLAVVLAIVALDRPNVCDGESCILCLFRLSLYALSVLLRSWLYLTYLRLPFYEMVH